MTNADVSVGTNLHEEVETSTKNSADTESSPVKRTTDSSCSPRKKPEGRAIVNDEDASKNDIPNKRVTRKSKKKVNLDKKKPAVTKKDEQKVGLIVVHIIICFMFTFYRIGCFFFFQAHKNIYKSLDDYENWHLSSTTNETHVNKENQATNSNKPKVFSPSHKVTEYFVGLKLDDSSDRDLHNEQDLEEKQVHFFL